MADVRKKRTIRDEEHQLVVLMVHTTDHLDRPRECRFVYSTDLGIDDKDLPRCISAWVPTRLLKSKTAADRN